MLSRRDKLLIQPWEDRRFKDHRLKVTSALPVIDCTSPAARPHVARKLKLVQRERERGARIVRDNFTLLQRLAAVTATSRLDNRWLKPPPNFQNKVGRFREVERSPRPRGSADTSLQVSCTHVRCYACEHLKTEAANEADSTRRAPAAGDRDALPYIYCKR